MPEEFHPAELNNMLMGQNPGTLDILSHSWLMDLYSPNMVISYHFVGFEPSPY